MNKLEKLGKIERKVTEMVTGMVEGEDFNINKMLACELLDDGELWLHVNDVRELSLVEKITLLLEGFKKLATALKNSPKFKDVKLISGTSWMVSSNPTAMKRLGFTIDNNAEGFKRSKKEYSSFKRHKYKEGDGVEPSYAYISKEKFIELYGS